MRVLNGGDSDPDLPAGWASVALDDLGYWVGGGTPSKDNQAFWTSGTIPWVSPKDMKASRIVDTQDHVTEQAVGASAASIVPAGAVLIVTRSGILRHSLPVAVLSVDAALNQDLKALVLSDGLDSEYVAAALRAFAGEILERCTKHGTTVHSIEFPRLKSFRIPVAPANEQRRIVAKVDELLSDLDAGLENLQRARALLAKYRQAVLKAAVTGELTREWREKRGAPTETGAELLQRILKARRESWEAAELAKMRARGRAPRDDGWKRKYKEPEPPDRSNLPKLPDGWIWASLDQLSWSSSYGTSVKCDYSFSGEAVLRIPNIRPGILDHRDLKRALRSLGTTDHGYLRAGDMLIIRTNGSLDWLGQAVVLQQNLTERTYFASYLIRFRIVEDLPLWKWINVFWQTQLVRNWIRHHAATSAGQYNVSQSSLARAPVPIPATAEIVAALERVDDLTTFLVPVEDDLRAALRASSSLRQAILTSAFCGALVAQHPDDEPASVLLERIRAERTAEPKPARGRRRGAGAGGRQLELLG